MPKHYAGAHVIDCTTRKPLYVSTDGDAGPYIMVPVEQIDDVRKLLDANDVRYWVDEDAISLNGKPEITIANLGSAADPKRVQDILDSAE